MRQGNSQRLTAAPLPRTADSENNGGSSAALTTDSGSYFMEVGRMTVLNVSSMESTRPSGSKRRRVASSGRVALVETIAMTATTAAVVAVSAADPADAIVARQNSQLVTASAVTQSAV